jgi:hypothetical protein
VLRSKLPPPPPRPSAQAELVPEQLHHARQCCACSLDTQKHETASSREKVIRGEAHLVARGIDDLSFDDVVPQQPYMRGVCVQKRKANRLPREEGGEVRYASTGVGAFMRNRKCIKGIK